MNRFFRSGLLPLILIVLVVYLASSQLMGNGKNEKKVTLLRSSRRRSRAGQVKSAVFNPNKQSISFKLDGRRRRARCNYPSAAVGPGAFERLLERERRRPTTRRESEARPGGRS